MSEFSVWSGGKSIVRLMIFLAAVSVAVWLLSAWADEVKPQQPQEIVVVCVVEGGDKGKLVMVPLSQANAPWLSRDLTSCGNA